ncbi:class I histocompatibility antigen, F10 alpha chain-like [Pelodiscus sinensis]|uniref:class I histocompatibility antigen, F10 alpha chain-like n=1 Tax=Pelodiscus sinensis TaxID=13735 RepID=UPI003F6CD678
MASGMMMMMCGGLLASAVTGGHHQLAVMVTVLTDEDGTHHYTMTAQADNVRFMHYSSDTREVSPSQEWAVQALGTEFFQKKTREFWTYDEDSKGGIRDLMKQHNQTAGVHTEQVYVGCALSDQTPVDPQFQYGYDGQDYISFDLERATWVASVSVAFVQKQRWEMDSAWMQFVQQCLRVECLETLRSLVQQGRGFLERQVPPEVSVSRRDAPHGPVTLSCRASGFHPRPIHLSWVRDGGDVLAETSSSGILPLADGTYHTQSSLEIDPRPDGPRYACRVEHSSLPAPVLVWAPEKGPLPPGVLAAIVLAALGLAGATGAGVWLWRRKSATKTGEDLASSSALEAESLNTGSRN